MVFKKRHSLRWVGCTSPFEGLCPDRRIGHLGEPARLQPRQACCVFNVSWGGLIRHALWLSILLGWLADAARGEISRLSSLNSLRNRVRIIYLILIHTDRVACVRKGHTKASAHLLRLSLGMVAWCITTTSCQDFDFKLIRVRCQLCVVLADCQV